MPPERKSVPRSPDHAALGKAIEALMARGPNTSQMAVSDESGIDLKLIGSYIRGRGNPSYTNLLRLCKGLHAKPVELIALAEEMKEAVERESQPASSGVTATPQQPKFR